MIPSETHWVHIVTQIVEIAGSEQEDDAVARVQRDDRPGAGAAYAGAGGEGRDGRLSGPARAAERGPEAPPVDEVGGDLVEET